MKKTLLQLIISIVLGLILAGCDFAKDDPLKMTDSTKVEKATTTPQHNFKPKLVAILRSTGNALEKKIKKSIVDFASTNDQLQIDVMQIEKERDIQGQVDLIDLAIKQEYDMMIIIPTDSSVLVKPIKRAMEAGMKVVVFDNRLNQHAMVMANMDSYHYVGPDNRLAAREASAYLTKLHLQNSNHVAILEGEGNASLNIERKQGFMDTVKNYGLRVLAARSAHWETSEAAYITDKLLNEYPNLDAIFASDDAMALGAAETIKLEKTRRKIKVIGFGNTDEVRKLMVNGDIIIATQDLFVDKMVTTSIAAVFNLYQGRDVPMWLKTPTKLITAKSLKHGR